MAYDFKGTFNASQFQRFVAFAKAQKADVAGRITHLAAEKARIGALDFHFDAQGIPTTYVPEDNSYIGKLVAAYEVLGGDPFYDLNVRTKAQAVYMTTGDVATPAQLMSNGEVIPKLGLADAVSAELMDDARGWIDEALQYKRDYLERKIRRALDYADQLEAEIASLTQIMSAASVSGSLENTFKLITNYINDPNYRAIYDDGGKDPWGKLTHAPFKPYSAGPDRAPDDFYGRDTGTTGALVPGQTVSGKGTGTKI